MPLRITVVHADQDAVGPGRADSGHLGGGFVERGQVTALVAGQVDRVQMEVLVAAAVAQVQQGVGAVGPEVVADAARLVVGNRACGGQVVGRRDPHVHHSFQRRDPAQVLAVGTDLHPGTFGIAEQGIARDQFHLCGCGRCVGGGSAAIVLLLAAAGSERQGKAGHEQGDAVHGGWLRGCRRHRDGHASADGRGRRCGPVKRGSSADQGGCRPTVGATAVGTAQAAPGS